MKKFNVTYVVTISHETMVTAENEKEARKKFKEVMPYEKIEDIWEIRA